MGFAKGNKLHSLKLDLSGEIKGMKKLEEGDHALVFIESCCFRLYVLGLASSNY